MVLEGARSSVAFYSETASSCNCVRGTHLLKRYSDTYSLSTSFATL